ncbi:DarT ssDNA thymidine ADP-ribosyltransferase family protein [Pseudobutyrivibrio sp.]|uniref:type II toxin-antitoxin system toxin DNA ADP-ribosyl transferase DarT n=1 Tax=Pseudobutyrivibrio sp. TaxID=2014367 RepID=UPI00386783E2
MKIPEEYNDRYIFHFTHIDNLKSIIDEGLLSTSKKKEKGIGHFDVANGVIQERRETMKVTEGPRGTVHDYVPFYFAITNKMLLSIVNNKSVDQEDIIFLVMPIAVLEKDDTVFSDRAANCNVAPNFYFDPKDLDKLSWDEIDSMRWGEKDDEAKHKRMAEALIYGSVNIEDIEEIIVYDEDAMKRVSKCFDDVAIDCPRICIQWFLGRSFYFKKPYFEDRKDESLVTGPKRLRQLFFDTIENIKLERKSFSGDYKFKDITDAIAEIDKDFCAVEELAGIFNLETENTVHKDTVSDHTKKVVNKIRCKNCIFNNLEEEDKNVLIFSAYLHDIGKGPKDKWKGEIQKVYIDHPADSLKALNRILIEDIEHISDSEIRKICLLVTYHDLLGDILKTGRKKDELDALGLDTNEKNMLVAMAYADINSIENLKATIEELEGIIR